MECTVFSSILYAYKDSESWSFQTQREDRIPGGLPEKQRRKWFCLTSALVHFCRLNGPTLS